ncbi:MAG: DUF4272 domain-containing protein [Polyangiaceae bacterium]|nr:DUF4272 domain-containing protein [Polyangiaceae bacterium]
MTERDTRSAAEIAERIVGLTALLVRLNIELANRRDPAAGQAHLENFHAWLEDLRIHRLLSPDEQTVIGIRLGELTDDLLFSLNWRLQAVAALLWSVGRLDTMPPYDRSIPAAVVQAELPIFKPIEPLVRAAQRRAPSTLREEQARAELWHWRARMHLLELQGMSPPAGDTFQAAVARGVAGAASRGIIAAVRDGDIDCDGTAFGKLPDAVWRDATSSIMERHYALNWVCGTEDWDEVSTHT